jgi:transmembrane sensor
MKKTNLDRLLQRYIAGQVTEQEKKKIEAWLDVKKTDEGSDLVLDEQDEERLFRKITAGIDNVEEIKSFRPGKAKVRALFSARWLQVAATLLVLVAASYTVWLIASRSTVHETITKDTTEKVILEDGTIVWLEERSRLTYVNNGEAREATLAGEGLFEVAKDPSKPFTVLCGEVSVKVLGTSFHLKSANEGIELKVLTGNVSVLAANQEVIEVASDEMATYSAGGEVRKVVLESAEKQTVTARTEYNMEFRNAALEDVVGRIEKKFDAEVIVQDARAKECRITADFTDHSLESTLEMISEFLDVQYSIEDNAVTLTGAGCH